MIEICEKCIRIQGLTVGQILPSNENQASSYKLDVVQMQRCSKFGSTRMLQNLESDAHGGIHSSVSVRNTSPSNP